jgi:hypothetical protein
MGANSSDSDFFASPSGEVCLNSLRRTDDLFKIGTSRPVAFVVNTIVGSSWIRSV